MVDVGEALSLGDGKWDEHRPPQVVRPDQSRVEAAVQLIDGEPRAGLSPEQVDQPGFYTVHAAARSAAGSCGRLCGEYSCRESIPNGLDLDAQRGPMGKWTTQAVGPAGDKGRAAADLAGLLDRGQVRRGIWDGLLGLVSAIADRASGGQPLHPLGRGNARGGDDRHSKTQAGGLMFQRLLPEALKLDFSRVGPFVMAALGLGVLAVILAYTVGLRWHHQSSILRRLFLLALRLSAVACVVFALLHPTWDRPREEQSKPVLGVLLDNSRSMARPFADQSTGVSRYAKALTVLHEQVQPALGGKYRLKLFDVDAHRWTRPTCRRRPRPLSARSLPAW